MMTAREKDEMGHFRAREELKVRLLKVMYDFKSKEEPTIKLTEKDIIRTLAEMLVRKFQ